MVHLNFGPAPIELEIGALEKAISALEASNGELAKLVVRTRSPSGRWKVVPSIAYRNLVDQQETVRRLKRTVLRLRRSVTGKRRRLK